MGFGNRRVRPSSREPPPILVFNLPLRSGHHHVRRPPGDRSSPSELVRAFAERFVRGEWPGERLPRLYYDPRSLESVPAKRASLHAKCVVVDREQASVSSANFTEAAQTRNIEAGVYLRSPSFAGRLAEHFETLAMSRLLQPVSIAHRTR